MSSVFGSLLQRFSIFENSPLNGEKRKQLDQGEVNCCIKSSNVLFQSDPELEEKGVDGKPFTAYTIEVENSEKTWHLQKRVHDFLSLHDQLKEEYQVPQIDVLTVTTEDTSVECSPSDAAFNKQIKCGLAVWLERLCKDDEIRMSPEIDEFLEITSHSKDWLGDQKKTRPSGSLLSPKEKRAQIGLEDFVLLKVVGKGSFGKVLQVRKIDTGKIYAMKILKKQHVIRRNQVDHTKTERNVLEHIRHPFIVSLRYAFQSSSKLYLVLDYCPGGELFFHLGRCGKFTEHRARFYAAEITLAIEYLHNLDIVYRDLKPENVLLDEDGHVALTDFGLSKEGISDNTSAHSFCGTPEYLAPEILQRVGHGRAADWWSLGALLYEMLTGMPPFYSRDRERLFKKILSRDLRFPIYFSSEVKSLLKGLMNRNAQKRLGSKADAIEIKSHPFFNGVDWDALLNKKIEAPFRPYITKNDQGIQETNNFDVEFTGLPVHSPSTVTSDGIRKNSNANNRFEGFTYCGSDERRAKFDSSLSALHKSDA